MTNRKPIHRVGMTSSALDSLLGFSHRGSDAKKQHREERRARLQRIMAPILDDLKAVGWEFENLDDVRRCGKRYIEAIPILLSWLPTIDDLEVKEMLVRALSVPWARPAAIPTLLAEFRNSEGISNDRYRWTVGNALSIVADHSVLEELLELASNKKYGFARQMVVLSLGKMKNPERIVPVLIELLSDTNVVGQAVAALGKLRANEARKQISALANHENEWIRAEVKKALTRIDGVK